MKPKKTQPKGKGIKDLLGDKPEAEKSRYNFALKPQQKKILDKYMQQKEIGSYSGAIHAIILDFDNLTTLYNETTRNNNDMRHEISEFEDLKVHLSEIFKHIRQ